MISPNIFSVRDGERDLFRSMAKNGVVPATLAKRASINYEERENADSLSWFTFLSGDTDEKESA